MDIAAVSMQMSAMVTQQAYDIAMMKNVNDLMEQTAQSLIAMLEVGPSPHQVDIEV